MNDNLEAYLHQHIPISQAMGIKVEQSSPHKVVLQAPFANNINHKKTVFGGSLHAVATLACWCLLYENLKDDPRIQIVITHSDISYIAPVVKDFKAECLKPGAEVWQNFVEALHRKGKGRIELSAKIEQDGRLCVAYQGTFAAL